jgi:hypothetical protein
VITKPPAAVHALLFHTKTQWKALCGYEIIIPTARDENNPEYPAVLHKVLKEIQINLRMAKDDKIREVTCSACREHPKFPLLELKDTEL